MRARARAGILDLKQANEWVVTTKLGSSDKRPGTGAAPAPVRDCKMYLNEMMMSTFVLTAAFYGIFSVNKWSFSIFLTLQGARADRVWVRVGVRCTPPPARGQCAPACCRASPSVSLAAAAADGAHGAAMSAAGRVAWCAATSGPDVVPRARQAWSSWLSASTWWTAAACWASAWARTSTTPPCAA